MSKSSRKGAHHYILPADASAAAQFEHSVQVGDTKAVREFIKRQKIPDWFTPTLRYKVLCKSVSRRHRAMVALLLKLNPVLELETSSKTTLSPLWTAVIYTYREIARLLIDAGADLHKRLGPSTVHDPESTMLHYLLAISSHPEREQLIELMIERGADVNTVDSKGKTPLHYAVTLTDNGIASKLISKGADVNVKDVNGITPLLAASQICAKDEILTLLIENGADVLAQTPDGCNALHLLANSCDDGPDQAEILLKQGVSLRAIDSEKQYTPLHYAVLNGKEKLTKIFLDHGANVHGWEGCCELPLCLAAARVSTLIIKMLVNYGAELEYKTTSGQTALHIACKNMKEKNILTLLQYGANINALDDGGATPFSLIEYNKFNRSIRLMIRTIAKHTVLNKPTNEIDLGIIKDYPELQEFYDDCLNEIDKMRRIILFDNITYFSLFSKSIAGLAYVIRAHRSKFPLKMQKINVLFRIHRGDFKEALRSAESLYDVLINEKIF